MIGLSVFQAEFDFGVSQFRLVFAPMLIAGAAGMSLVAARLYGGAGVALYAAFFFVIIRGIVSFIVGDVFGQAHHVFPLYLGSAVIIELLAMTRLKDRPLAFGAVGGLLIGTVGSVIEKLWNDLVFPFPWPQDIWLEGLLMTVPVAVGTGLCGALFYMGLTGRLPAPNVGRLIVVGTVLVISASVANGLWATVPKNASASIRTSQVGTDAQPQIMTEVTVQPADLIDDNPAWVQLTAWQGGTEGADKGIVTHSLKRTGDNTWESTRPVPVGGNWKTLLRVQDGRTLAAVPIFLPEDPPIDAEEVPVEAESTRDFVPEIEILQRERELDAPPGCGAWRTWSCCCAASPSSPASPSLWAGFRAASARTSASQKKIGRRAYADAHDLRPATCCTPTTPRSWRSRRWSRRSWWWRSCCTSRARTAARSGEEREIIDRAFDDPTSKEDTGEEVHRRAVRRSLLLAGCGGDDTGTVSSSPDPAHRVHPRPSEDVVVDIAIKDGKVTPQGDRVEVKAGQKVTLRITSDAHETIHVHSEPEHEFEIGAGDDVEKSFTIDTPGQIAVEAHHLDVTIVQLVVRP